MFSQILVTSLSAGEGSASGMATILSSVTSIVTSAVSWMGSFLSTITTSGNEILLLFVLIPIVGLGIGLLRRLMNLN